MARAAGSDRPLDATDETAQRAARVRAMLLRWAAEDVTDEPDWDVAQVAPVAFEQPKAE